jgi:hypothetical protein
LSGENPLYYTRKITTTGKRQKARKEYDFDDSFMLSSEKEHVSNKSESYENLYGILSSSINDVEDFENETTNIAADKFNQSAIEHVSVIANTINTLLGVSLFATPWGYEESGVALGTVILVIVATISFETARTLLAAQKLYFQRTGEILGLFVLY